MTGERVEVSTTKVAVGGDAIARDGDGRVVFVEGAIPGERVAAVVTEDRRDFRRATVVEVIDPSPARTAPPCANVGRGCGGCGWQHIALSAQRELKVEMMRDALRRIARLGDVTAIPITSVALADRAFRTTMRAAVIDGRAAFHRSRSHELVEAEGCHVAHPLIASLLDGGDFGDAHEATVRAGVASGERAALIHPTARGVSLPDDVEVVTRPVPGSGVIHEEVAGLSYRVSIGSFFQASPLAAHALVEAVLAGAGSDGIPATVADLYAGVGLFSVALIDAFGSRVVAVERSRSAVADARVNLRSPGGDATVAGVEVGAWRPDHRFDVVVADPARPGLGQPGVAAVARCAPRVLVLVSCDAASLARDVMLAGKVGFRLDSIVAVDAFPHTPHLEAVATLFAV